MRLLLAVVALVVFIGALCLGFELLMFGSFSGSEFISFVVAFAVICVVVGYGPEVQEISIAGNIVKLKEIKAEAVAAIEGLKESRVEMLRMNFDFALVHGYLEPDDLLIDKRTANFWALVRLAEKYGCVEELKFEILKSIDILMGAQLYIILNAVGMKDLSLAQIKPNVFELTQMVLTPDKIALAQANNNKLDMKIEIEKGLQQYLDLDMLRLKLI